MVPEREAWRAKYLEDQQHCEDTSYYMMMEIMYIHNWWWLLQLAINGFWFDLIWFDIVCGQNWTLLSINLTSLNVNGRQFFVSYQRSALTTETAGHSGFFFLLTDNTVLKSFKRQRSIEALTLLCPATYVCFSVITTCKILVLVNLKTVSSFFSGILSALLR